MMDSRMIQLIKAQDEQGIYLVIDHYGALMKHVITQHLYQLNQYTDECLNDVLLAVWQHIDDYDTSKSSFKNWLAVISRYHAIDFLRKYHKEQMEDGMDAVKDKGYIDKGYNLWELEWQDLISGLTLEEQNLMNLLYKEGYSPEETAVKLHTTKSNIYNKASRTKKRLKEMNGGYYND